MSRTAADIVETLVKGKPDAVLGLATGSTPVGLYQELARRFGTNGLDFSRVTSFNLDEYVGLASDHDQSYHYFMQDNLFQHINIPSDKAHVPDGMSEDHEAFCEQYEQAIVDAGGIDLQVLGIGGDGHIAFNEPGSSLGSRTRLKTLTNETVDDNSRFFDSIDDVPRYAITMGVGTILEAGHCVLMANGEKKAEVVALALEGPVSALVTASALQLHRKVTVILDEPAASKLKLRDYYRWVYEQKPG